jgi:uncharacterized protein YneF (UPF0154 family)
MNEPISQGAASTSTAPNKTIAETPVAIKNPGKIKTIIVVVIVLIILILGSIIGYNLLQKKQKQDIYNNGQSVIQLIFNLRTQATAFYQINYSYKEWWPDSQTLVHASALGSTIIYRKPDFQNYIIYAFIPADQKYFCIDTTNKFAGEVSLVTDGQSKCQ